MDGLYNASLMGSHRMSASNIIKIFKDELSKYLLIYNAANENPIAAKQLRDARKDARRIAVSQYALYYNIR